MPINHTKRGGREIIHEEMKYVLSNEGKQFNTWRCTYRTCSGRLHTEIGTNIIIKCFSHTHTNNVNSTQIKKIKEMLTIDAETTVIQFDDSLRRIEQELKVKLPPNINIRTLRDSYTRKRNEKQTPKMEGEKLLEIYKYTFDNQMFLQDEYYSLETGRIYIYSTALFVSYLSRCKVFLSDGTFFTAPKNYEQLYIIHGYFCNQCVPLIWCIMEKKSKKCYEHIFNYLLPLLNISPAYWITDFEQAQLQAIKKVFPTTQYCGCFFHFSQICIRHLQSNNLITKYKENPEFKLKIRKILALAFIPASEIYKHFDIIVDDNDNDVLRFCDFFYNNFLSETAKKLNKDSSFWSVNERILNNVPTTTNSCEAYHRHINTMNKRANESFEKCINNLKKEEQRMQRKIGNIMAGINRSRVDNMQIRSIVSNYEFYSFDEFFVAIADYCNPLIKF